MTDPHEVSPEGAHAAARLAAIVESSEDAIVSKDSDGTGRFIVIADDLRQLQPSGRDLAQAFRDVAKPLSRAESMRFWSDKDIRAGEWEKQIEAAMRGAVAAVLLVSDNSLPRITSLKRNCPT